MSMMTMMMMMMMMMMIMMARMVPMVIMTVLMNDMIMKMLVLMLVRMMVLMMVMMMVMMMVTTPMALHLRVVTSSSCMVFIKYPRSLLLLSGHVATHVRSDVQPRLGDVPLTSQTCAT